MPPVTIVFYQEEDGTAPLLEWLDSLKAKARDKCTARIVRLGQLGYELRRPEADYLRDGIYELRAAWQHVNYRILYFFHDREAVVLSHGFTKQRVVPPKEIELAIERMTKFKQNPGRHTHEQG